MKEYYDLKLGQSHFPTNDIQPALYESCIFKDIDLSNKSLDQFRFEDAVFQNCDLSNASITGTAFRNTKFEGCRLMGLFFNECNPVGLRFGFTECVLDFSVFEGLSMPATLFDRCRLVQADFSRCMLKSAVMRQCELSGAIFDQTDLGEADLRSSVDIILDPSKNNVTKAKFGRSSLPGLLEVFGILIDESC